jgi:hypothetical protein
LLLDAGGIAAAIEGVGPIASITEARFEWAEIWKGCLMLEKGFWDVGIS